MIPCVSSWRHESRVPRQTPSSPARWGGLTPVVAAIALAAGCMRSDGLVPVAGTVKLDGATLSGALVTFHAEPGVRGNGGSAMTDAAGRFTLLTPQARKGVFPGEYRITVTCRKPTPDAERRLAELAASGLPPTASDADMKEALADAYTKPDRTPLRQEVGPAGASVTIDLDSNIAAERPARGRR